jgi:hypothetical protein
VGRHTQWGGQGQCTLLTMGMMCCRALQAQRASGRLQTKDYMALAVGGAAGIAIVAGGVGWGGGPVYAHACHPGKLQK